MKTQLLTTSIGRTSNNLWSCQVYQVCPKRFSSLLQPVRPEKPYYVTTPIFYVNAVPHVGHLYSLVLGDIFKRWAVLRGKKAILCTGTDEHGMKIQRAALNAGQDVRALCDQNSKAFDDLAKKAEIERDHFIRTSEPEHRFAVQYFWQMLKERGYIYASKHEGWYSISDETFYPESSVHLALDPSTGRKFMASIETGKEVEWTSENNYHFRLSAFKDRLEKFYIQNDKFIVPSTRMKEVIEQVRSGLEDLSISRPVERLSWGIPVPYDDSQTIYVWMDALINYLTKANYPFQIPGHEDAGGWPVDLHVIGKDIVRFHAIYWPAFLMALDLPLPKQILAHAHWTLGKEKMSKSLGNVVDPFFALERFGVDGMRYFLARNGGIKDDAMYDNSFIIRRYKKELQGVLGNLLSRVVRGKGWNVRKAVQLNKTSSSELATDVAKTLNGLQAILLKVVEEKLNVTFALEIIITTIKQTNQYMQKAAPWGYATDPSLDASEVSRIIYLCAESLRICGIFLQPYMPSKMKMLLDFLGVEDNARTFDHATLGADLDYGTSKMEVGRGREGVLFPSLKSHF